MNVESPPDARLTQTRSVSSINQPVNISISVTMKTVTGKQRTYTLTANKMDNIITRKVGEGKTILARALLSTISGRLIDTLLTDTAEVVIHYNVKTPLMEDSGAITDLSDERPTDILPLQYRVLLPEYEGVYVNALKQPLQVFRNLVKQYSMARAKTLGSPRRLNELKREIIETQTKYQRLLAETETLEKEIQELEENYEVKKKEILNIYKSEERLEKMLDYATRARSITDAITEIDKAIRETQNQLALLEAKQISHANVEDLRYELEELKDEEMEQTPYTSRRYETKTTKELKVALAVQPSVTVSNE